MTQYYLVKFEDDYADEFYVYGYKLFQDNEFNNYIQEVRNIFGKKEQEVDKKFKEGLVKHNLPEDTTQESITQLYYHQQLPYATYQDLVGKFYGALEVEKYFGTNEFLTFSNFNDFMRCFTVKEISEEEYNIIKIILGFSYGETCGFELYNEEEDNFDDE